MTLRTEVIETGLNFNTTKYSVMYLRAAMKYRQLEAVEKKDGHHRIPKTPIWYSFGKDNWNHMMRKENYFQQRKENINAIV